MYLMSNLINLTDYCKYFLIVNLMLTTKCLV